MKLTFEQWLSKQDISPISPEAHYAEEAWNALLNSIEIKLPKEMKGPKGDGLDGDYEEFEMHEAVAGEVNSMLAKCAKAIKAAGLKVKA